MDVREWKRRLRRLKALEIRIRFGGLEPPPGMPLVWDDFFHRARGRYSIAALKTMDKADYDRVLADFFFRLYDAQYAQREIGGGQAFDAGLLAELGLPYDADAQAVRSALRRAIAASHPDVGGDVSEFLAIMDRYRALFGKGAEE